MQNENPPDGTPSIFPELQFKPAPSSEYQRDCFLKQCSLVNLEDGKTIYPHCYSYKCPLHGWKKKKKLVHGLESILDKWDRIRLWTFTMSHNIGSDAREHYKILSEVWRRFITELRRNVLFTSFEKDLQYLKVIDLHQNGYIHYHMFFDRFIHINKIYILWNRAIQQVAGGSGSSGYCYAKSKFTPKGAAHYVAKYVVKAAHLCKFRIRSYSKSGKIAIFIKTKSDGLWHMFRNDEPWVDQIIDESPLLDNILDKIAAKKAKVLTIPMFDPVDLEVSCTLTEL